MPAEAPGRRVNRTATKEVRHGDPSVEKHAPGIAFKAKQEGPFPPTYANAQTAKKVAIGEEFVIGVAGRHPVRTVLIPAGAEEGTPLYITEATNALSTESGAGKLKFGVVEEPADSTMEWTWVNFDLRDSY